MPSTKVTSWTAWSTPEIVTAPAGRSSVVRQGRAIGRDASAPQRVLHRQNLHLDDPGRVGGVADLEHERAVAVVDPEVAVALALQRVGLAVDAEDAASDLGGELGRDLGRPGFEDVVAHGAPR